MVTALRVEEETLACDLNHAGRWHIPYAAEDIVWVAEQDPGWVRVFTLSGWSMWWPALYALPEPGGRVFSLSCDTTVGEVEWEELPVDHWERLRQEGADLVGSSDKAQEMNFYLAALAYTTGRFIDDTWFTTPGLLCRIPEGAWSHE
ncbi:hypothetical protein [Streptosporangium sp. NPDC023615]|uniref:hypothetical protein n=1 Tax=Streptosporangium sp. NPDC023615 TaxID=3154794 RepID=UPI00343D18F4